MKLKKIFIIIIVLLKLNVNAQDYYSEYYKTNDIEGKKLDEYKIEQTILYNTYKKEKTNIGYLLNTNDYIKDTNDYILTKEKRIIYNNDNEEYVDINYVFDNENTDFIFINNIKSGTKIYEINLYENNNKKTYYVHGQNKEKNINDSNLETFYESHHDASKLTLNLNARYCIYDLKIEIITKSTEPIKIEIEKSFTPTSIRFILNNNGNYNNHYIQFNKGNYKIDNYYYDDILKYNYYYYKKIPTNNYEVLNEYSILDDYIIKKDYYIRDKLSLSDEYIIQEETFNPYNYIIYNSNKVEVVCKKNNQVECIYKIKDLEIKRTFLIEEQNEQIEKPLTSNIQNKDNIEEIKQTNEIHNNIEEIKELDNTIVQETKDIDNKIVEKKPEIDNTDEDKTKKSVNISTTKIIKKINKNTEISSINNSKKTITNKTTTLLKKDKKNVNKKHTHLINMIIIMSIIIITIILRNNKKFCRKCLKFLKTKLYLRRR